MQSVTSQFYTVIKDVVSIIVAHMVGILQSHSQGEPRIFSKGELLRRSYGKLSDLQLHVHVHTNAQLQTSIFTIKALQQNVFSFLRVIPTKHFHCTPIFFRKPHFPPKNFYKKTDLMTSLRLQQCICEADTPIGDFVARKQN